MTTPPGHNDQNAFGYGLIGLIILLFIGAAFCSKEDIQTVSPDDTQNYEQAADNLDAAAEASAPLPMDVSAVQRGASQLKLVALLDLPNSRQIFSQNCYDALDKKFDWHELDRCGGFDAMAVRWVDQSASLGDDEIAYFQSEAAATRFLAAATANGLVGRDADIRWATLESSTRKLALPRQAIASNDPSASNVEIEGIDVDHPGSEAQDDPLAIGSELSQ
jgi:hypothetical protein